MGDDNRSPIHIQKLSSNPDHEEEVLQTVTAHKWYGIYMLLKESLRLERLFWKMTSFSGGSGAVHLHHLEASSLMTRLIKGGDFMFEFWG